MTKVRKVSLVFPDSKEGLGRIEFMNNVAEVVRVLHFDQKVNVLELVVEGKKIEYKLISPK